MADELTATGLSIDAFETRLTDMQTELRSLISATLDLSVDQPTGQLVRVLTERIQAILELIRAIYSAWDPDSATGHSLTALALLTGTQRSGATFGTVSLTVNLDAGITLPAGSIASVDGDATNRWVTDVDVTNPAGIPADVVVAATAELAGVYEAPAATITVIAVPVANWNSVNNVADATAGLAEETDTALRLRREVELAAAGSTTVDAIRADVSQVDGVIEVLVLENATDWIDGNGVATHAFETIIWDDGAAADLAIAAAIFGAKAAGVNASGGVTSTATDDQGNAHVIKFTRATERRVLLHLTVTTDSDYEGPAVLAAEVAAECLAYFAMGLDVYITKMADFTFNSQGIVNVVVQQQFFGGGWGVIDLVVDQRSIATVAAGDITVV